MVDEDGYEMVQSKRKATSPRTNQSKKVNKTPDSQISWKVKQVLQRNCQRPIQEEDSSSQEESDSDEDDEETPNDQHENVESGKGTTDEDVHTNTEIDEEDRQHEAAALPAK